MLRSLLGLLLAVSAMFAASCAKDTATPAPASSTTVVTPPALTRIADASLVCMINDLYMGKAQIPVVVDGKTYFGCCPACEAKLSSDPASRTAVDPVTGESVDKATAVLAQNADGTVLYFASEQSLQRYPTP